MLKTLFFLHLLFGLHPPVSKSLAVQSSSSINLSEIRDVVYTPQGNLFSGKIVIEPRHFQRDSPPVLVIPVKNGMFEVALISTSTVFPSESYTVTYTEESGTTWTELWRVPVGNRLSLKDVRIATPNLGGKPMNSVDNPNLPRDISFPLPMVDIAGLSSQLDTIATSLTQITNSSNALSSAILSLHNLQIIKNETPAGPVNGTNTVFTLANTPLAGAFQLCSTVSD